MRAKGFVAERYMRWARLVFGWQSSPYFALCMHVRGLELAIGDPSDTSSAFQWARVELNLPGASNYILPHGMLVVMVLGWSMHVPLLGIGYIRGGGGR
jgi:hypothetical protein